MIALEISLLEHTAAGLRVALTLLALMLLLNRGRPSLFANPGSWLDRLSHAARLDAWAWTLLAVAILSFSPLRSAFLLGVAAPPPLSLAGDILASGFACAAFILRIAKRGHLEGMTPARVRRGMLTNIGIVFASIASTWISR